MVWLHTSMMSLSSPLYIMIARWPSPDLRPVQNNRSKYRAYYLDNFPGVLFSLCTRLPVPHTMHCAELLQSGPASDQNAYFGGRSEPAVLSEPASVLWRILNGIYTAWSWRSRTAPGVNEGALSNEAIVGPSRVRESFMGIGKRKWHWQRFLYSEPENMTCNTKSNMDISLQEVSEAPAGFEGATNMVSFCSHVQLPPLRTSESAQCHMKCL